MHCDGHGCERLPGRRSTALIHRCLPSAPRTRPHHSCLSFTHQSSWPGSSLHLDRRVNLSAMHRHLRRPPMADMGATLVPSYDGQRRNGTRPTSRPICHPARDRELGASCLRVRSQGVPARSPTITAASAAVQPVHLRSCQQEQRLSSPTWRSKRDPYNRSPRRRCRHSRHPHKTGPFQQRPTWGLPASRRLTRRRLTRRLRIRNCRWP